MTHFPMLCKARWAQMPAERAHTFLATPSRMQNHRSKERRAAQRRLYSRLSTLKRRTSCGRGTPCVNTFSEAIASIMLRETPDDRRVAAPGLHLTHGRVTIVVVWKRFVKKMNLYYESFIPGPTLKFLFKKRDGPRNGGWLWNFR